MMQPPVEARPSLRSRRIGVELRRQSHLALWLLLVALLVLLVLLPIGRLQIRALADGGQGFRDLVQVPGIGRTILRTVGLAVGSVVVAVPLGTFLAIAVTRVPARWHTLASLVPLLPLVVPAVASVLGWAFLASPTVGYLNSALRATVFTSSTVGPLNAYSVSFMIWLTGLLLSAFVYLFVYTGLRSMGREFEVAAQASGAGEWHALRTITLPLLRPHIVYGAGIAMLSGLGQFTVPLLLGRRQQVNVLTTKMHHLLQSFPVDYGLGAALGSPLLLVGLGIVIVQRYLVGDQRRFVTARVRTQYPQLRRAKWPLLVIGIYGLVTVLLPLLSLLYTSLSPYWQGRVSLDLLTLDNYRVLFSDSRLVGAIRTSTVASLLAALLALPVGLLAAVAVASRSRVHRAVQATIEILMLLPLGVPAAVMGFALLFSYTQDPFVLYGTRAVIVVTYVTLMLPYALRFLLAQLIALGEDYLEASKTCGGGPIRTFIAILLPLSRKAIASAMAIMVVLLFHEFAASMMVRSARAQVMGTVLYDGWTAGSYPPVAAMALVMVAVTAVGVFVALRIGGRDGLERI